jgi:hypothetical protein
LECARWDTIAVFHFTPGTLDLSPACQPPIESCFPRGKAELVYMTGFPTREAAKKELFAYIEGYCNRQWLHSAVGYIMPERAE